LVLFVSGSCFVVVSVLFKENPERLGRLIEG
jgi:hypothetical protein